MTGPAIGEREASIIAEEIRTAIDEIGPGLRVLLLDMQHVCSLSSMGLGMCLEVRNAAHDVGARAVLYGLRSPLEKLVKMLRVHRMFTLASNPRELEKALR